MNLKIWLGPLCYEANNMLMWPDVNCLKVYPQSRVSAEHIVLVVNSPASWTDWKSNYLGPAALTACSACDWAVSVHYSESTEHEKTLTCKKKWNQVGLRKGCYDRLCTIIWIPGTYFLELGRGVLWRCSTQTGVMATMSFSSIWSSLVMREMEGSPHKFFT